MSTSDHEHFMRAAMAQAELARTLGDVPVGAVVVLDGEIVGVGHNRREIDQDPAGHAELIAIRAASKAVGSWRLERCTVYVTLEPCPMCSGLMVLSRVERCVFGAADPKGGFLGTLADISAFPGLNHRFDVVPGVLREPCSEQLRAFFREVRRKKKQIE